MRDDFKLIVDKIATDSILTSEIIRLQDKFCSNSLHYLTLTRDSIKVLLHKTIPSACPESCEDVANFLSGLHSFSIKLRVAYIKKRLPHFSKWFINAMATNNIVELFEVEQTINTAHSNLCKNLIKDGELKGLSGSLEEPGSEMAEVADRIRILDSLKSIHCKSNRTVSDTVKKYFEVETIENLEEVLRDYESESVVQ